EKIDFQDINKELGFLPPVKVHCAQMAIRALRKAIEEYLVRNNKTQITNDK
ncbi:MAG: iron-sulfur cluster assembly scaffold protein, partial [Candidatus Portnoybacteria bacterium CG10_big_fil_rev_8_21_14_0_10_40_22]